MARLDDEEARRRKREKDVRYYWANRGEVLRRRHERDVFKRSDVWIPFDGPVTEELRRRALKRAFYE